MFKKEVLIKDCIANQTEALIALNLAADLFSKDRLETLAFEISYFKDCSYVVIDSEFKFHNNVTDIRNNTVKFLELGKRPIKFKNWFLSVLVVDGKFDLYYHG